VGTAARSGQRTLTDDAARAFSNPRSRSTPGRALLTDTEVRSRISAALQLRLTHRARAIERVALHKSRALDVVGRAAASTRRCSAASRRPRLRSPPSVRPRPSGLRAAAEETRSALTDDARRAVKRFSPERQGALRHPPIAASISRCVQQATQWNRSVHVGARSVASYVGPFRGVLASSLRCMLGRRWGIAKERWALGATCRFKRALRTSRYVLPPSVRVAVDPAMRRRDSLHGCSCPSWCWL
jgi:hypothetical protein